MSGAGRKHRGKHLTQEFLDADSFNGLGEDEALVRVLEAPNAKRVRVTPVVKAPSMAGNGAEASLAGGSQLVQLPGRFNRVLWLGVGDVVVVRFGEVTRKVTKDQMKSFVQTADPFDPVCVALLAHCLAEAGSGADVAVGESESDDDLVNPNHAARQGRNGRYDGSGDDSDDEDEDDEEEEDEDEDGDESVGRKGVRGGAEGENRQ